MTLRVGQFVTIMLIALAMAAAVAHAMELPAKVKLEPRLYVMLHRTLYPNFGRIAGVAEFVAVVVLVWLVWRVRENPVLFIPTLVGALSMIAAHAVFWVLVQPANTTMAAWSLDAIPTDWEQWRNRWEYSHAARSVLIFGALAAVVFSVVREHPC
jgi:hypothetical protein